MQTAVLVVESPSQLLAIVLLLSAKQDRQDPTYPRVVECEIPVIKVFAWCVWLWTLMSSGRGFDTDCPIVVTASVSLVTAAFIAVLDDC